jgi:hypothetical protein
MSWLLRLMLVEEFRLHTSHSNPRMFLSFPAIIFLFAFGIALTSDRLLAYTPLGDAILLLHLSVFLYGLSVGAFGFLGHQYLERRSGTRNYIVTMPNLLPMRLRRTFLGMYVRDALFYVLLLLAPATLGLLASVPATGFRATSIGILFGTSLLTFLVGMALSFFVSTVYVRSRPGFIAAVAGIGLAFGAFGLARAIPAEAILPGLAAALRLPPFPADPARALAGILAGLGLLAVLVGAAVAFVPDRYEPPASRARDALPAADRHLAFLERYGTLLAKELVDLARSGTVVKMFFSFVTPLILLSFTAWFVRYGLAVPVGFNSVFYAAMVGFFGVMLYNWLTNLDATDYLATVPVSVPEVIRGKLLAFFVMTSWITAAFVVGISVLNADVRLLWIALPVALVTSAYMVSMTAYLTGLRTNSFLFDPGVLAKFTACSMVPDLGLTILSFTLDRDPWFAAAGIGLVLVLLGAATYFFIAAIEPKWRGSEFGE